MGAPDRPPPFPFAGVVAVSVALILALFLVLRASEHHPKPLVVSSPTLSPAGVVSSNAGTGTGVEGDGHLPECNRKPEPAPDRDYDDWDRTLVDTDFDLRRGYVPPGRVSVTKAGFDPGENGRFEVRSFVIHDLRALREAVLDAGNPIDIVAAYRSYDEQDELFHERKNEFGTEGARAKTAAPGHSEHQLGTTIDFKSAGEDDVDATWERTPAGAWMAKNAYRFGFVMSYPRHEQRKTCYVYEPWHYRYFGVDLARQIHDSGLTPREYLWQHLQ